MNVICVDDEKFMLMGIVSCCEEVEKITEVNGFRNAKDALDYVKNNTVDVAFLDIDMPDMNGIELAKCIKDLSPNTSIIFTTGYAHYANSAMKVNARGYLMKPIETKDIEFEMSYLEKAIETEHRLKAVTFGNFDFFINNRPIVFHRSKSKEILAYLIDKNGTSVTRAEISAILWEDDFYDRSKQMQLNTIINDLKKDLEEAGCSDILIQNSGSLSVDTSKFYCDMYEFLKGNIDAINSYRGEYMMAYSWAEFTNGVLSNKVTF